MIKTRGNVFLSPKLENTNLYSNRFAGSEVAFALLYPMEMLFENYIAAQMKRELKSSDFGVSTQDRTYHLFTRPNEVFQIKPDMIVTRHSN